MLGVLTEGTCYHCYTQHLFISFISQLSQRCCNITCAQQPSNAVQATTTLLLSTTPASQPINASHFKQTTEPCRRSEVQQHKNAATTCAKHYHSDSAAQMQDELQECARSMHMCGWPPPTWLTPDNQGSNQQQSAPELPGPATCVQKMAVRCWNKRPNRKDMETFHTWRHFCHNIPDV